MVLSNWYKIRLKKDKINLSLINFQLAIMLDDKMITSKSERPSKLYSEYLNWNKMYKDIALC